MIPGCPELFAVDPMPPGAVWPCEFGVNTTVGFDLKLRRSCIAVPQATVIEVVITRALILSGAHVPDPVPLVFRASVGRCPGECNAANYFVGAEPRRRRIGSWK
jgi:hypothetical protein